MLVMRHYLFLLLLMFLPCTILAQVEKPVRVKGRVTVHNKETKKDMYEAVYFALMSKSEAQRAHAEFERLTGDNASADASLDVDLMDRIDRLRKQYSLTKMTKNSGRYELNAVTGWCLLFLTVPEKKISNIVEIVDGKEEYDVKLEVVRTDNVNITGMAKDQPKIGGSTGDPDDGNEYFGISIDLPAEYAKDDARLVIQTFAVDCQTEDTVAYCMPLAYESRRYHDLQDKRMDFDFFENDSLRHAYQASMTIARGERIKVDTTIVFKKTERKRKFRGPYVFQLGDYHRVYYDSLYAGTCLRMRPFKFLDFSPALAEMELTEEFKEEAEQNFSEQKQDLNLQFEIGKAELKQDSINTVLLNALVEELQSYGEKLVAPQIKGMASPDGNLKTNKELAERRAQKAAGILQRYVSKHVGYTSDVYTWNDVVERLRVKGKFDEAEQVNAIISRTSTPDRELRQLEFYEQDVMPILDAMRVMKVSYQYMRAKILSPKEALQEYTLNKPLYQAGKKKLSNGDYWNIFDQMTDSVELDTLTMVAYRQLTKDPDYATDILAPYVCNRVALINLRKGTPNARVLEPFIDFSRRRVNAIRPVNDERNMIVNRAEMLMNQAITYYQEQKMDSARFFIDWLDDPNRTTPEIREKVRESLNSMRRIMDLKRLHYITGRDADQERAYKAAKDYVLEISDENKAILFTEIPEWHKSAEAMNYVDLLPDDMPKKWYLKGLLWAQKGDKVACHEPGRDQLEEDGGDAMERIDIGGGFHLLSEAEELNLPDAQFQPYQEALAKYKEQLEKEGKPMPVLKEKPKSEDDDVDISNVPYYLSYFHHAFELEPLFKRMYFEEGHVPEDMRKKPHCKYKKKDIPAYRKLFSLLQAYDKRQLEKPIEKDEETAADTSAE